MLVRFINIYIIDKISKEVVLRVGIYKIESQKKFSKKTYITSICMIIVNLLVFLVAVLINTYETSTDTKYKILDVLLIDYVPTICGVFLIGLYDVINNFNTMKVSLDRPYTSLVAESNYQNMIKGVSLLLVGIETLILLFSMDLYFIRSNLHFSSLYMAFYRIQKDS